MRLFRSSAAESQPTKPYQAAEEALALLPNLVKLGWRLAKDPRIPFKARVFAGLAVAYAMSPLDVLPGWIPLIGQLDDILLLILALQYLMEAAGETVVREYWEGSSDVLEVIEGLVDWGSNMVPWGVRKAVKRYLHS